MLSFARFFRYVQDAPWYDLFLEPVLEALQPLPADADLLDIGTGTGGFIEQVARVQPDFQIVGTDINAEMLEQAQQRPFLSTIPLHLLDKDAPLPFADATFDVICFCSVLFLLDDPSPLLDEAVRLLRPNGRIIILTPTGNGRSWAVKNMLPAYAAENKLTYHKHEGFMGLAVVEILSR